MYRRSIIERLDQSLYDMKVYDWMFNIVNAQFGLIGFLPEVMSAYRQHGAGTYAGMSAEEQENETLSVIDLYNEYLGGRFTDDFFHFKQRILDSRKHRFWTENVSSAIQAPSTGTGEEAAIEKKWASDIRLFLLRVKHSFALLTPQIVRIAFSMFLPPIILKAAKRIRRKIEG
jgi:hypothetical protein